MLNFFSDLDFSQLRSKCGKEKKKHCIANPCVENANKKEDVRYHT